MRRRLIAALLILSSTLIGLTSCRSHVSCDVPGSCAEVSALGVTFGVPDDLYSDSEDYLPIINMQYETQVERDAARMHLRSGVSIHGITETSYLLTDVKSSIFYVGKCRSNVTSLESLSREQALQLCTRSDLNFLNFGRYIAVDAGGTKAVMRVDFSINYSGDILSYSGYLGLAQIGGSTYFYLAGYRDKSDANLRVCYNCVRTLS